METTHKNTHDRLKLLIKYIYKNPETRVYYNKHMIRKIFNYMCIHPHMELLEYTSKTVLNQIDNEYELINDRSILNTLNTDKKYIITCKIENVPDAFIDKDLYISYKRLLESDVKIKNKIQKITICGNDIEIKDGFLKKCNFREIIFYMPDVEKIGNEWLSQSNVKELYFKLPRLIVVGDYWMYSCKKLQNFHFNLPKLIKIGNYWLSFCKNLQNTNFTGLSSVEIIGSHWVSDCVNLQNPYFYGLHSLKIVGNNWMSFCVNLENPSFTGLSSLETIGYNWLVGCYKLKNPNFNGLSSLETFGLDW